MPYDYYSMPFCKPPEGVRRATSTINPGTILLGIRIENSPYNFTIMVSQSVSDLGRAASGSSQAGSMISQPMQPASRLAFWMDSWPGLPVCAAAADAATDASSVLPSAPPLRRPLP
jgi:hypothetical protein